MGERCCEWEMWECLRLNFFFGGVCFRTTLRRSTSFSDPRQHSRVVIFSKAKAVNRDIFDILRIDSEEKLRYYKNDKFLQIFNNVNSHTFYNIFNNTFNATQKKRKTQHTHTPSSYAPVLRHLDHPLVRRSTA